MITIKDISDSKELDRKAMTEVRGGGDQTVVQSANGVATGGLLALNQIDQNVVALNNEYSSFDLTKNQVVVGSFGSLLSA
jgi:hypothetical protein